MKNWKTIAIVLALLVIIAILYISYINWVYEYIFNDQKCAAECVMKDYPKSYYSYHTHSCYCYDEKGNVVLVNIT